MSKVFVIFRSRYARYGKKMGCIFENLEPRAMMFVGGEYYSLDGTGNNLDHPTWGAAGTSLMHIAPVAYNDKISTLAGAGRPSARGISNSLSDQTSETKSDRMLSDYVYAWGQFIDHDLDLTPDGSAEQQPIHVPMGDSSFDPDSTGTATIPFGRSIFTKGTGTSTSNPRLHPNTITSYLDGSMIYGSGTKRAAALRTFKKGLLKTSSENLPPYNTAGFANDNDTHALPDKSLFLTGDVRANENIDLSSLHTLFIREHNRLAGIFAAKHSTWKDEKIFQHARQIVIAEIQHITYDQFIPALLGSNSLPAYTGYNPKTKPAISAEFSIAAFRVGHTLLNRDVQFFNDDGSFAAENLIFLLAFDQPDLLKGGGVDTILKYLADDPAQEIDLKIEDAFRNLLFGQPGDGGTDLMSLDIQRGRDMGLNDYNTTRQKYGLPKLTSFSQITTDVAVQNELQSLYQNVNNIDLIVGGLAEDHQAGASVGPTFDRIMTDQFRRTREGDRLWFENTFTGDDLAALQNTSLSDIIHLNTTMGNLQQNPFIFFPGTISGNVFLDGDKDGKRGVDEKGLSGVSVKAIDSKGKTVATKKSTTDGTYTFTNLPLGAAYQIKVIAPSGYSVTSHTTRTVELVTDPGAGQFNIHFGLATPATKPPLPNNIGGSGTASLFPGVNQTRIDADILE
jgi:peroxidase